MPSPNPQPVNAIETALQIINLFNVAAPGIANLILLIRNSDPSKTIGEILKEADAQWDKNITQAIEGLNL